MMVLHCNRCGRETRDLTPELPAGQGTGSGAMDVESFYVCAECYPSSDGRNYRYCARCGHETPSSGLEGGRCDWCRSADVIPFDEPSDDQWWADKAGPGTDPASANPP